jgi:para-nitrobenzyl esterase
MESGACLTGVFGPRRREDVVNASTSLVNQLCPGAPDPVACLRGLPASAFVPSSVAAATMILDATSGPYIDGDLIQGPLLDRLRAGTFHHVPILGGSNAREPAYFELMGVPPPTNRLGFTLTLASLSPDHWQPLDDHFMPATDADANEALIRALTDDEDRCPMRVLARGVSDLGIPAYLYSFEVPPSGHAQELDYVFGWPGGPLSTQYDGGAPLPPLPDVLDATQAYWTNFARGSDPNDGVHVVWPEYTRASDAHMTLGPTVVSESGLGKTDCDWWDGQFAP